MIASHFCPILTGFVPYQVVTNCQHRCSNKLQKQENLNLIPMEFLSRDICNALLTSRSNHGVNIQFKQYHNIRL